MWRYYWFKLKWWRKKQSLQQCNALTDVMASFGVKNALLRDCYAGNFLCEGIVDYLNALSANFTKWSNTLKQFVGNLTPNCLSVFGHFVRLVAFKGFSLSHSLECYHDYQWQGVRKTLKFWIALINWKEPAFEKLRGSTFKKYFFEYLLLQWLFTNIWYP